MRNDDAHAALAAISADASARDHAIRANRLAGVLSFDTWINREIPTPERLLGNFITTGARVFLVGRTGLGKTHLAMALAHAIASGSGFCHWRASGKPRRVLYVDGEMPADLIKARCADLGRRTGSSPKDLLVYSATIADHVAAVDPALGGFAPLNTEPGFDHMREVVTLLAPDVIFFDNVMSLLEGNQAEEEAWAAALRLVMWLSERGIAQVWLDHTGHDHSRQYGSATKAWRFDTVGVMTPLESAEREPGETAFRLSFDPPGKARRRSPENWSDFDACVLRLAQDRWTSTVDSAAQRLRAGLGPVLRAWWDALLAAVSRSQAPHETTRAEWLAELQRRGALVREHFECDPKGESPAQKRLRTYAKRLGRKGLIACDGECIRLTQKVVKCLG